MTDYLDKYMLNTNLNWDGYGEIVDQLKGKSFSVNGKSTNTDYAAEQTTAIYHDYSDDLIIDDITSTANQDYITVSASKNMSAATGLLVGTIGIKKFTITLVNGVVLTQDNFNYKELAVRVLGSEADSKVVFDFADGQLETLKYYPPIAAISFPNDATQNNDYTGVVIGEYDNGYAPACFTRGTRINTSLGERPVETLSSGDLVLTRDHGFRPLCWIGSRTVGRDALKANPALHPIRIAAGALGFGVPARDLWVSQQHRMLVRSRITRKMFGTDEVLVAAKHLLGTEGIEIDEGLNQVTYVHFMCEDHEIIFAEGASTESLYLGQEARKTLGRKALAEIFEIFPGLREHAATPPSARELIIGRLGRKLAERHRKNGCSLVSAAGL